VCSSDLSERIMAAIARLERPRATVV
jgi:hypothetical protein